MAGVLTDSCHKTFAQYGRWLYGPVWCESLYRSPHASGDTSDMHLVQDFTCQYGHVLSWQFLHFSTAPGGHVSDLNLFCIACSNMRSCMMKSSTVIHLSRDMSQRNLYRTQLGKMDTGKKKVGTSVWVSSWIRVGRKVVHFLQCQIGQVWGKHLSPTLLVRVACGEMHILCGEVDQVANKSGGVSRIPCILRNVSGHDSSKSAWNRRKNPNFNRTGSVQEFHFGECVGTFYGSVHACLNTLTMELELWQGWMQAGINPYENRFTFVQGDWKQTWMVVTCWFSVGLWLWLLGPTWLGRKRAK